MSTLHAHSAPAGAWRNSGVSEYLQPSRTARSAMTHGNTSAGADAARTLAAIVESSDDAIIAKDLDGTILSWNGGAERMYGYSAADAVGRSVYLIVPEAFTAEL